jgi:hypothetical protein
MNVKRTLPTAVALLLAAVPAPAQPRQRTIEVNCGAGGRLADALATRGESLVVRFRGTCAERVTIARDDVTLAGSGPEATLVGSVTVDGASRVRLQDFTVRDTPGEDPFSSEGDAIRILASHKVTLERVRTQDTGRRGVSVEESAADLIDGTVLRAGGAGIQGTTAGINVFGTLAITDGAGPGLLIASMTHVFLRRDARLVVDRNAIGLVAQGNGTMTVSNESKIRANNNSFLGILVTSQGDVLYGEAEIEVRGNGVGVLVSEHANWTPFVGSPATIRIRGNTVAGVVLERGGFLEFGDGTATVTGNGGPGLIVDDSRVVLRGTTVRNNAGGDVLLSARASAIFNDSNLFGTPVACDGTVLVRGTASCAAAAPLAQGVGDSRLEEIRRKAVALAGGGAIRP